LGGWWGVGSVVAKKKKEKALETGKEPRGPWGVGREKLCRKNHGPRGSAKGFASRPRGKRSPARGTGHIGEGGAKGANRDTLTFGDEKKRGRKRKEGPNEKATADGLVS